MSRGRSPRRPHRISYDPVGLAIGHATLLTPTEVATTMAPLRAAAKALREGVATELQWQVAASAANVADAIEDLRLTRGLAGHIREVDLALQAIQRRAMASGAWRAPTMYYQELDLINLLVELHEHQLKHLSYGEIQQAIRRAVNQTSQQAGGRVIAMTQVEAAA